MVLWDNTKEGELRMPRKKIEKIPTLAELIPLYGEQNTACNALKKVVSDLNSKIKTAIHDIQKENTDIEIEGWKCSLTVTEEATFNEDRLIEFAKKHKLKIVKTKEYIDEDALERLIYNGQISKELLIEMDKCKDVKTKETLRCVKLKEKKDGDSN